MVVDSKIIDKIILGIEEGQYDNAQIKIILLNDQDSWKLIVAKIILNEKNTLTEDVTWNYDFCVYIQKSMTIKELIIFLKKAILEKHLSIDEYSISKEFNLWQSETFLSTAERFMCDGWPRFWYLFTGEQTQYTHKELIKADLPYFPTIYNLVDEMFGFNLATRQNHFLGGIVIILPVFKTKILEFKVTNSNMEIEIYLKEHEIKDIVGKLWGRYAGNKYIQKDVIFQNSKAIIKLDQTLKEYNFILLDKRTEQVLDKRNHFSTVQWGEEEESEQNNNIELVIASGENQETEFKETIELNGDSEKIAKELIAFSNTDGGVILFGVTDEGNIKGMSIEFDKFEKHIQNLCDTCNPAIKNVECKVFEISDKKIYATIIHKGVDKPYMTKNKNTYVRRGSTVRKADVSEIESMTNKQKVFRHPFY